MPAGVFGTVKSSRTIFGFSGFVVGTDIAPGYNGQIYFSPENIGKRKQGRFSINGRQLLTSANKIIAHNIHVKRFENSPNHRPESARITTVGFALS